MPSTRARSARRLSLLIGGAPKLDTVEIYDIADQQAQAILITDDAAFAAAVEKEIAAILTTLAKPIARESWALNGGMILVQNWQEALPIIATIAPEHLELAIEDAESFAQHVTGAGAIDVLA